MKQIMNGLYRVNYFRKGGEDMKCPYCIKVCIKCKRILVAYSGNFYKRETSKYGVRNDCKECRIKYQKQYCEEHKEEHEEYRKQYYEENKEKIIEREKKKYEVRREDILEQKKQYYEENKEVISKKKKQYNQENPHLSFNANNKRRQLEENQGRGTTKEQWYEMMCWFDWKCAYSGTDLTKDNRSVDHIVALNNGGKHEIWNCVPMFRPYNSSKFTNDMEEWYAQQEFYSEERLIKIYAWCEYAFDKWKPRRKGNRKIND